MTCQPGMAHRHSCRARLRGALVGVVADRNLPVAGLAGPTGLAEAVRQGALGLRGDHAVRVLGGQGD